MVLLPVGADLRVVPRGSVIDDFHPIRQERLLEQGVQCPVEYQRVLVVDGDVDCDLQPVNPRLLRWRQGVRPFKHGDCQLDEGENEQNGESAHEQVGSLVGDVEVGPSPYAYSSADDEDDPRGTTRTAEAHIGNVVGVGHRSPRPLRRRQNNRIATVSATVATPVSMIPHVSALSTGDMTHTSRLPELPDLEQVLRVVQLACAIDQPVSA